MSAFVLPGKGGVSVPSAAPPSGTTVREAVEAASRQIAVGGCESPRLDAELLLAHALGLTREQLLSDSSRPLDGVVLDAFELSVRRRAQEREPLAYITGWRYFRRLRLAVDPRALIPRPESELLVEVGARLPAGARVLDAGTGSGAVALALKDERPDLSVTGSDHSSEALAVARENARRLGLEVGFLQADLLAGIAEEFEAVLANLPYVAEGERGALAPEIARHEPAGALFAGAQGLDAITALIGQLARRPAVRLAALEVGAGQAPNVARLLREAGFATVRSERDLAGIERVVTGEGRRA
jgi:release factor glutamine methyltransferase